MFAADAFEAPQDHIGTATELAGDELTGPQIAAEMQAATGLPARFVQQPIEEVRSFSDDLARMLTWFDESGYSADIPALRARHPEMRSFGDWLRASGWQPDTAA